VCVIHAKTAMTFKRPWRTGVWKFEFRYILGWIVTIDGWADRAAFRTYSYSAPWIYPLVDK